MNNARRKLLDEARGLIAQAQSLVATAAEEEQEYYDNMPESLQMGDKGDRAQEVGTELEVIASELEDFDGRLQDVQV